MESEGGKSWNLPIVAQLAFQLWPELCERRANAISLLKRIGRNRNKALITGGFDSKQRLVGGPKTGCR